nr:amidohydrolase family protein [uncultured Rhodopila sp.]
MIGSLLPVTASVAQTCTRPPVAPYAGQLFDAMAQTDQSFDGEAAIATARAAGVARIALFARVHHSRDGRALVSRLAAAHPDFIVHGAPKFFDMRGDLDNSYVRDVLAGAVSGQYKFVGELLYTHGDKAGGEITTAGERSIDPTQPNTHRLIAALHGRHVPVMTHWEIYDWGRDWPRFDRLYGEFPDQVFIWPHAGFSSTEQLATVLAAHGNVWATLSRRERVGANLADPDKEELVGPPVVDDCGILHPDWRMAILRFRDRLMFATVAHKPKRWGNYAAIVRRWRLILAQLPPDAARAIGFDNAARLYGP